MTSVSFRAAQNPTTLRTTNKKNKLILKIRNKLRREFSYDIRRCMVKHLDDWEISKKVCDPDLKINAEHFSGPNITFMKDLWSSFKQMLQPSWSFMLACWH